MIRGICIIFSTLALVGCDLANKQEAQHDDPSNPYYKQAQQDLDNNNPTAAVNDYEAALGTNPKLAGAQYELGVLYSEKLNDPIGSIFHFKRYLDLAPNSDKADQVKALIDKQSQAFAASLPNSPTQSADDYAQLQAANATLKKQVDDAGHTISQLQAELAKHHHESSAPLIASAEAPASIASTTVSTDTSAPDPAASTNTAPTPATPASTNATSPNPPRALPVDPNAPEASATAPAATAGGPSRTYTVVKGDSIWKIAHKMYPGDTKNGVEKIQEANKDAIGNKPLKIGQVLVIP